MSASTLLDKLIFPYKKDLIETTTRSKIVTILKLNENSQAFALAIEQRLAERLVLRYRLQNLSVSRHVADRPLAEPCTAQPEYIAASGCTNRSTFNLYYNFRLIYISEYPVFS